MVEAKKDREVKIWISTIHHHHPMFCGCSERCFIDSSFVSKNSTHCL